MAGALPPSLTPCPLPGYECAADLPGVTHSREKLEQSLEDFVASIALQDLPSSCVYTAISSEEETLGYRCSCAFQIVGLDAGRGEGSRLEYCMRNDFRAVPLGVDKFPVANARIQEAMAGVISSLRAVSSADRSAAPVNNLTSCKYISSWDQREVFLTLSYSAAVEGEEAQKEWREWAEAARVELDITAITARFRKGSLSVGKSPRVVVDTLDIPPHTVTYHKPEDAFTHPNPTTMMKALRWILSRVAEVSSPSRKVNLLEMYCGCGAHTVPIAKCAGEAVDKVLCVEVDQRLVDFCMENVRLNGLEDKVRVMKGDAGLVSKRLLRRRQQQQQQQQGGGWGGGVTPSSSSNSPLDEVEAFDLLLVDPPRQGLDSSVLKLAMSGEFSDMLYVSCGREALKRDLQVLCKDHFEVANLCVTDLFPRTDSVETLVHLRVGKTKTTTAR